jgi:hypothetical protein
MAIAFHAELVDTSPQEWGTRVIWSADSDLSAELYLIVMRTSEFSEQDVRLGMNNVYVETCGQGWSWYGHILAFELFPDHVSVQLDAEAAKHMRDDGRIEATFDLDTPRLADLKTTLRQVFAGYGYYVDHTS